MQYTTGHGTMVKHSSWGPGDLPGQAHLPGQLFQVNSLYAICYSRSVLAVAAKAVLDSAVVVCSIMPQKDLMPWQSKRRGFGVLCSPSMEGEG